MSKLIFINYRRDDSSAEALLVRDALRREFGEQDVFMDVTSIKPGARWPKTIEARLRAAATVIAIVGPNWLLAGIDEYGRRRIDHKSDWVRRELETAFKGGKTVIPLLIRDGKIPPAKVLPPSIQCLAQCQAVSIRRDYWDHDIQFLLAKLHETGHRLAKPPAAEFPRTAGNGATPHGHIAPEIDEGLFLPERRMNVPPGIARGLLALKKRIAASMIPSSKRNETINIAVWNIREFGRKRRTEAAIHYIAEIVRRFDLLAIVGVGNHLDDLGRLMAVLGASWKVFLSDRTDYTGDNAERDAFLYDGQVITRDSLVDAGIVVPRVEQSKGLVPQPPSWHTPCVCAFRAGNLDFLLIDMHVRWDDRETARQSELQLLTDWIQELFSGRFVESHDLIVLGEFSTHEFTDEVMACLRSCGLNTPTALENLRGGGCFIKGANLGKDAPYSQILHCPTVRQNLTNLGGLVDFYISDARIKELFPSHRLTREEFTYQMSDRFPLWIQINTDVEGFRLNQIVQDNRKA